MKPLSSTRALFRFTSSLTLLLGLAACVSTPEKPVAALAAANTPTPNATNTIPTSPSTPYKGDGPCPNPPSASALDATPDAKPVPEPFLPSANRPYIVTINGQNKSYVPEVSNRAFRETGKASWYGCKFHGEKTASGELFDTYKMTAAHPILPIPSYIKVTNLENNRSVILRVNDRGPFVDNRVVDVSYVAAHRLGFLEKGVADVEVERVLVGSFSSAPQNVVITASAGALSTGIPSSQIQFDEKPTVQEQAKAIIVPSRTEKPAPITLATTPSVSVGRSGAVTELGGKPKIYLQLGAFSTVVAAQDEQSFLQERNITKRPISYIKNSGLYKVILGPFATQADAQQEKRNLSAKGIASFMVSY